MFSLFFNYTLQMKLYISQYNSILFCIHCIKGQGHEETVWWHAEGEGGHREEMWTWNTGADVNHGEVPPNQCKTCGGQRQGNRESKERNQ